MAHYSAYACQATVAVLPTLREDTNLCLVRAELATALQDSQSCGDHRFKRFCLGPVSRTCGEKADVWLMRGG